MPSSAFTTSLLLAALASGANAQSYFNLEAEDNRAPMHGDRDQYHGFHPELDHAHDRDDYALRREEESQQHHKHFREVHHPHEDVDFGSYQDEHRHDFHEDDRHHPRESAERTLHHQYQEHVEGYEHHELGYGGEHHHAGYEELLDQPHHDWEQFYANQLPLTQEARNAAYDNVLDDDDPSICFVKAYARKPLSTKKGGQKANAMDYWYDDYDVDEDQDDLDYGGSYYDYDYGYGGDYMDDYDNYVDEYGDYSDSEDQYYDDEEDNYGVEDGESVDFSEDDSQQSSEEVETSSEEEDNEFDQYDFSDEDVWDKESHFQRHFPQAQYFDLAQPNQQAPPATPAASGSDDSDTDDDSQESEETEQSDDSSADENAYAPRRHRQGRGKGGRRTKRHPTAQHPRAHAREPEPHAQTHPRRRRRAHAPRTPHPMPAHAQPHATDLGSHFPAADHRRSPHGTDSMADQHPVAPHDRHRPPPSARRHRKTQQQPHGRRAASHARKPRQHQQQQPVQHRRPRKQRRTHPRSNDEDHEQKDTSFTCPKFFEKTDEGCEKPLSLWRGNGQGKTCKNCQKCEDRWYPQCPPSFISTECDVCAPVCPDGMIDHDGTCIQPGEKLPTECGENEQLIDGECYRQCPGQTSEFDILCFGLCPINMTKCGHTLCLKPDQQCPQYVADKAIELNELVLKYKRVDHHGSRLIDLSHQSMFPFPECH